MLSLQGNLMRNGYGWLLLCVSVFYFYIENEADDFENWGGYKVLICQKSRLIDTRRGCTAQPYKNFTVAFFASKRACHDFRNSCQGKLLRQLKIL